MVAPVITGDTEVEVAGRYAAGESIYSLAKQFKCSGKAIRNACKRQGVEIRENPKSPKLTPRQIEEAVALYKDTDGISISEVARKYGISGPALRHSILRRGVPIRHMISRAEKHGLWKGGRHLDKHSGYVRVRLQPDDWLFTHTRHGYMQEHRYVMANNLSRPLEPDETVHHINGIKHDNRLENLELHRRRHGNSMKLVCACCGSSDIREVPLQ